MCLITWFVTKNVYSFREIKIYHSLPARAVIEVCKFSSSSILIIHLVSLCIFETHEKIPKKQIEILFNYFFFFAWSTKSSPLKLFEYLVSFKKLCIFMHLIHAPYCFIPFLLVLILLFAFVLLTYKRKRKKEKGTKTKRNVTE